MKSKRRLCIPELLALALLGAACEDESGLTALTVEGTFEPAALEFGEVTVGSVKSLPVVLRNTGDLPLSLEDVRLPQDFTLRGLKTQLSSIDLPPGDTVGFDVVFLPRAEGARSEVITLIATEVEIELPVTGVGTIRRVPQLTLDPSALDFGALDIGVSDRRTVTLRNDGTADASVSAVRLGSSGGDATMGMIYALDAALPITVPAGGTAEVAVSFTPSAGATFTETFEFDAGLGRTVDLSLRGQGQSARGSLTCTPPSLDFGPVERGNTSRLSVSCTASGGSVRIQNVTSTDRMQFTLPMSTSGLDLTPGMQVSIPVVFESRGALGTRMAQLAIAFEDAMGASTQTIQMRAQVTEPPATETAISLELTWNTRGTDVDIHLTAPGGAPFFLNDCYFGDRTPDWGRRGDSSDDCFLDVDDQDGLGPERINVSEAAPGTYRVYIHYYADRGVGPSEATVDVSVGGQSQGSYSRSLSCNDMWLVGEIRWDGRAGSFVPVDRIDRSLLGNCS